MRSGVICVIMLIIMLGNISFAKDNKQEKTADIIEVVDKGHGEFSTKDKKDALGVKKIRLKKIDEDIYEIDKSEKKAVKVALDKYIEMYEVKIDLLDYEELENAIITYGISDKLSEKLRDNAQKYSNMSKEELSGTDTIFTVYSPSKIVSKSEILGKKEAINELILKNRVIASLDGNVATDSLTYYNTSYYTINGVKYTDEILKTPTPLVSKYKVLTSGSGTKAYLSKAISSSAIYFVSSIIDKYAPVTLLLKLYGDSVPISTTNKDFLEVKLYEEGYLKYTGIYKYIPGYGNGYDYKAISARYHSKFKYESTIAGVGKNYMVDNGWKQGPNYSTLYKKAYEYRNTSATFMYKEAVDYYKVGNLKFKSEF